MARKKMERHIAVAAAGSRGEHRLVGFAKLSPERIRFAAGENTAGRADARARQFRVAERRPAVGAARIRVRLRLVHARRGVQ